MSRRLTFALAAYLGCVVHSPAWSADHGGSSAATDGEVEALISKRCESADEWESRRPVFVAWLRSRLGDSPAMAWTTAGEAAKRDHCSWTALRYGAAQRGRLFVPTQHVGRGPAVIYFAGGPMPASIADRNRERADWTWDACEDLARSGYVVMLIYEHGLANPAPEPDRIEGPARAWQATTRADLRGVEFLLDRREVDPERVAVLGVEVTARRAGWAAALGERLAAVASLGTPETSALEDRVLTSLIAPRPYRLALDIKNVRDRQAAFQHWVAGPQEIYDRYDLSPLLSTRLGAGFGSTPASPAWRDTLRWLKDELQEPTDHRVLREGTAARHTSPTRKRGKKRLPSLARRVSVGAAAYFETLTSPDVRTFPLCLQHAPESQARRRASIAVALKRLPISQAHNSYALRGDHGRTLPIRQTLRLRTR